MSSHSTRIQDHFADLTDPRRRKVVYPLINIVTIAICAVIAGADDFVAIAAWGSEKRDWLARSSTSAVASRRTIVSMPSSRRSSRRSSRSAC